jgi:hypothetical protein
MSLMLLVLLILTSITVTMVRTAFDNQSASRAAAAKAQARLYAAATLEEFYARVSSDGNFLRDVLEFSQRDCGKDGSNSPHPGLRSAKTECGARDDNVWVMLPMPSGWRADQEAVPTGSASCPVGEDGLKFDCYYVKVFSDGSSGALPPSVVVEVTLRTRCAGEEFRCTFTRFQQRLRRTQFFEFALAQELTTLAPEALFPPGSFDDEADLNHRAFLKYRSACGSKRGLVRAAVVLNESMTLGRTSANSGLFIPDASTLGITRCVDMSYHSDADEEDGAGDVLAGPLYTADDFITICGEPTLEAIYVSGRGWENAAGGRDTYRPAPGSVCVDSRPNSMRTATRAPMLLQPPVLDVLADAESAPSAEIIEKLDPNLPATAEFLGDDVRFSNVRLQSGEDCSTISPGLVSCPVAGEVLVLRTPFASSGSSYASVDLKVSGDIEGMVSVVVEGSVAIVGDLKYVNGAKAEGPNANISDVLTLTATERIEIWQNCSRTEASPRLDNCTSPPPGPPGERVVNGILTSGLGYVGVPDWQYNTEQNDAGEYREQQTLTFFGSIASRYQGVYGAYVETDERQLVSGFYKNFAHDNLSRILNNGKSIEEQLPFFVQTETAVWNRVDITEVPYRP